MLTKDLGEAACSCKRDITNKVNIQASCLCNLMRKHLENIDLFASDFSMFRTMQEVIPRFPSLTWIYILNLYFTKLNIWLSGCVCLLFSHFWFIMPLMWYLGKLHPPLEMFLFVEPWSENIGCLFLCFCGSNYFLNCFFIWKNIKLIFLGVF